MRPSGRAPDQMRALTFEPGFTRHAEGSCLVSFGDTRVLVTASVEDRVPPFLRGKGQGWVTAEYGMLPRATHTRGNREAAKGKQSGRTQEIQRLIGRSLRAVVNLTKLPEKQIIVDCDVIQADGGTRTASITGAWVALADCLTWMKTRNMDCSSFCCTCLSTMQFSPLVGTGRAHGSNRRGSPVVPIGGSKVWWYICSSST